MGDGPFGCNPTAVRCGKPRATVGPPAIIYQIRIPACGATIQRRVRRMKKIILLFATVLLFAVSAFSQIEGRVVDAKGNGVPNVTVTATGEDGKVAATVTTDEEGNYAFEELSPGKYKITVKGPAGFQPTARENVNVDEDETTTLDITLTAAVQAPVPKPVSIPATPQPKDYLGQMTALIAKLNALSDPGSLLDLSAQFVTIGDAQKTEWLPYYYAALAVAIYGWMPRGDQDATADKGNAILNKAEALSKGNSEIYIVRSMFAQQQMMVDPQSRWQIYGQQAGAALETARKLNPNNPRVYYMLGMSVFGTPEQFGGGKAKAKPIFEEAVKNFDAFKPESPLSPNWGRQQAVDMLKQSSH